MTPVEEIRFGGQVVLVTGAGRGLGRAYALLLAERGAHVVVHDAGIEPDGTGGDPSLADAVVREIVEAGGQATAAYENLGIREACVALAESVESRHGRVDALIHNAGLVRFVGLEETDPDTWELLRGVHVDAPLWLSRTLLPGMKRRRYGRFVITVSGHGLYRTGSTDLAAYRICKAAAYGLMGVLADEGEEFGIRANAISPVAATRMYRRDAVPGELLPEFVAPGVVYLASSACTVSGAVLSAHDGHFAAGRYETSEGVDFGRKPVTPEQIAAAWNEIEAASSLTRIAR